MPAVPQPSFTAYLGPAAEGYLSMTHAAAITRRVRQTFPFSRLARALGHGLKDNQQVIILGCGEGGTEGHLLRLLTSKKRILFLNVVGVDVNESYLKSTEVTLRKLLSSATNLKFLSIVGDFTDWAVLRKIPLDTQPLLIMVGNTFANFWGEEGRFLETLNNFPVKTRLALDFQAAATDKTSSSSILAADPLMRPGSLSCAHQKWFTEAVKDRGLGHPSGFVVRMSTNLAESGIAGGYRAEIFALIGHEEVPIFSFRRFNVAQVVEAFSRKGWRLIRSFPFARRNNRPGVYVLVLEKE